MARTVTSWPINLAIARSRLRLEPEFPSDDELTDLLQEAVVDIEARTGITLARSTNTLYVYVEAGSGVPFLIKGLMPTVTGITYTNLDKEVVTLDSDKWFLRQAQHYPPESHWVHPASGNVSTLDTWPDDLDDQVPMTVSVTRGVLYSELPLDLRSALLISARQTHDGFDFSRERSIGSLCRRYWSDQGV